MIFKSSLYGGCVLYIIALTVAPEAVHPTSFEFDVLINFISRHISFVAWLVIGIVSLIQYFGKNWKPITKFMRWIGNLMNADIAGKVDDLALAIDKQAEDIVELNKKMENKFIEQERIGGEKEKNRLRSRIIAFADSCRLEVKHSRSQFDNILRDITDYYDYCNKYHFENHQIEEDVEYIKDIYRRCMERNNFI